jgi:hypothetical protein
VTVASNAVQSTVQTTSDAVGSAVESVGSLLRR